MIVRTKAGEQAARKQLEKKVKKAQEQMEKKLWHLSKQEFAWKFDAEAAWKQTIKGTPSFLTVSCLYQEEGRYQQKGRPKNNTAPDYMVWHVRGTLAIDQNEVEAQIHQQASFILATNVIEEQELSHEQVYVKYKEQGGVERGFRFLKDPLFLASSVFLKKPERVIALSFIMVLCLLVYRLAERPFKTGCWLCCFIYFKMNGSSILLEYQMQPALSVVSPCCSFSKEPSHIEVTDERVRWNRDLHRT